VVFEHRGDFTLMFCCWHCSSSSSRINNTALEVYIQALMKTSILPLALCSRKHQNHW